ncbi:MAG: M1 family metallopeptidase [Bacteroidota bacterium]
MRRLCSALLVLFLPLLAFGQGSPLWQQRVAYEMNIEVDTERHQMQGMQQLRYTNNSPDTLRHVYYHLFFNAFHPNSMMAERNRHLPDPDGRIVPKIWNHSPEEIGYHNVQSLTQDGTATTYEVNDTILKVNLAQPILPGQTATFDMVFDSQIPKQTRRSGRDSAEGIDYSMSQWYPKMAGYDSRGWHADPYVGREFIAPFGTFDVKITIPGEYVLGGTGVVQNGNEVGYAYGDGAPDDPAAETLTWHFVAEDVHDFAWVADRDYVHETFESNGVTYHLLYQDDNIERWRMMSTWVPQIIELFSEMYGRYPYPQFTVAQAGDGGMEYPMINFITGNRSPFSLFGVTAHEAAHEWWYAAIGFNEADYAWMDEGFTNYATTEAFARIIGNQPAGNHTGSVQSIVNMHQLGFAERFSTPADWFDTNAGYGTTAYSGGQLVAHMLGYIIGDAQRDQWFKELYRRFLFKHPNPYDVEKVAEDVSGMVLDWFFEQMTHSTRTLDYAVTGFESNPAGNSFLTTFTLARKDAMVMPNDVRLVLEDGTEQWVHIPALVAHGHKPVPEGWIVTEPWPWVAPSYTFTVETSSRALRADLDPQLRTPDQNRLNNSSRLPKSVSFLKPASPSYSTYGIGWSPAPWYSDQFGPGIGAQLKGGYVFGKHQVTAKLRLWPLVLASNGDDPDFDPYALTFGCRDSGSDCEPLLPGAEVGIDTPDVSWFDGIDYKLGYASTLGMAHQQLVFSLSATKQFGLMEHQIGLTKDFTGRFDRTYFKQQPQRRLSATLTHLVAPTDRRFWNPLISPDARTDYAMLQLQYRVSQSSDFIALTAQVGGTLARHSDPNRLTSPGDASKITLDAQKSAALGNWTASAAMRLGFGAAFLAPHEQYRLGAGSWYETWQNDAARHLLATANTQGHISALNGSGPVAYTLQEGAIANTRIFGPPLPLDIPDTFQAPPPGRHLMSGRLTLESPALGSNALAALRVHAFSGMGKTWDRFPLPAEILYGNGMFEQEDFGEADFLADAGVGFSYDVNQVRSLRRWTGQSDVLQDLKLMVQFPIYASEPGLAGSGDDEIDFRWLVGIQIQP